MDMLAIVILLLMVLFLVAIYILFFRVWNSEDPFKFSNVILKSKNGVVYLFKDKLPCHTHFDYTTRIRMSLNDGWKLSLTGTIVNFPHCFNTGESEYRDYEGNVSYEKKVETNCLPLNPKCRYHLVFEGSFLVTELFINKRMIGESNCGYLPFRFDITEAVRSQEIIDVKAIVSNKSKSTSIPPLLYKSHPLGFHPFGGIHKDVYIEMCPPIYCFKCHVKTDYRSKDNNIELRLGFHNALNDSDMKELVLKVNITDMCQQQVYQNDLTAEIHSQDEVITFLKMLTVENPRLWSSDEPNLYNIEITTQFESLSVKFGFRRVDIINHEIRLNERKVIFKGVCKHEEDLENGLAESRESMDRDMALIKELNANYVRLSHYPHHPYFLDACDREGIMTWCEIALYQPGIAIIKYLAEKKKEGQDNWLIKLLRMPQMIWKTRQFTDTRLLSNAHDELLQMIERDFNHPSIIFWGIGNECWTFNPAGAKALSYLKVLVNNCDSSRIAGYAAMTLPYISSIFERSFKVMDILCINEYFGWYYDNTTDISKYLQRISKKNSNKPIIVTETGADCQAGNHLSGERIMKGVSEEYQDDFLKTQISILSRHKQFAGMSIWVLKDFLCPEYGADNSVPYYNMKGLVDKNHKKKKAYFSVQRMYKNDMKV